jgi:hypothetical protein
MLLVCRLLQLVSEHKQDTPMQSKTDSMLCVRISGALLGNYELRFWKAVFPLQLPRQNPDLPSLPGLAPFCPRRKRPPGIIKIHHSPTATYLHN